MTTYRYFNNKMERCNEYAQPLCVAFIDYEKAFDSVSTSFVLNALISQNINKTYVETLKSIYILTQPLPLNFTITATKFQYVEEYDKETLYHPNCLQLY